MNKIYELASSKPFLIMSHRGFWGGNIVENTRQSAQLAMLAGAEVIEIDVCRSKDGVYFVFHSTQEERLLGLKKHMHDITSEEFEEVYLINSIGMESDYRVEKFDDYLSWFPETKIINIDRSWWYWDDPNFYNLLHKHQCMDRVFVKNSLIDDGKKYLEKLNHMRSNIPYLPIATCQDDYRFVESLDNINLIGIEMIILDEQTDLLDPIFLQELKEKKSIILMDGEKLGRTKPFFMGREDDYSLLVDPNKGWGQMYRYGANIIETDWPNFLNDYRDTLL